MSCQLFAVSRGRGARASTAASDQAVLAAAAYLTGRDRRLARAVGEHRVLTTGQLAAPGFASVITARHRLAVLTGLGVLRRFRPHREAGSAPPWHYLLGPVGAALLGAEDRDDKQWLSAVRADRQLALERSQRLAHIVGVNWFFAALAAHARVGGGGAELRLWLNETATTEWLPDRELDQAGVTFASATEPFDTSTSIGRMLVQLLGVFAEFERETIIDRVTAGMNAKAAKGKWPGGRLPYGYQRAPATHKLVPDPAQAPVVRDIFRLYTRDRLGTRAIAAQLNARGLRTRPGKPWSGHVIGLMLANPPTPTTSPATTSACPTPTSHSSAGRASRRPRGSPPAAQGSTSSGPRAPATTTSPA
jgi:Replication-relaxation/Resolvase, N terminal domain/Recombinase